MIFKEITSYQAIKEIYQDKQSWYLLFECIDNSKEVIEKDGEISFDKSYDKLYYIDEKEYFWIGGYDDDKLCFLQFVQKPKWNHLELVVAQKKENIKAKNWFNGVVEYVKFLYPKLKSITTLPINDKLKDYYKTFGFNDYKHGEIKLTIN